MILFYDKTNGTIFGTSRGYKVREGFKICPEDFSEDQLGVLVLEREWERDEKRKDLMENISSMRVKDASKLEFEEDPDKSKTHHPKNNEEDLQKVFQNRVDERIAELIEKRVDEILREKGLM